MCRITKLIKNIKVHSICLLTVLLVMQKTADAQMAVYDVASFNELVTQAAYLQNQAQSLQTELKALTSGQYQWSNAQDLINQLGGVVNQSNSLSYSAQGLNQRFQAQYPGYQAPEDFNQQYQQNVTTSMNTINGVLQGLNTSANDFTNENARLNFLQAQEQNAQGQMQAIQAASQISSEEVSQLQLLRQTMLAQTSAQTAYYATQTQNDASNIAAQQAMFANGTTETPVIGSSGTSLQFVNQD